MLSIVLTVAGLIAVAALVAAARRAGTTERARVLGPGRRWRLPARCARSWPRARRCRPRTRPGARGRAVGRSRRAAGLVSSGDVAGVSPRALLFAIVAAPAALWVLRTCARRTGATRSQVSARTRADRRPPARRWHGGTRRRPRRGKGAARSPGIRGASRHAPTSGSAWRTHWRRGRSNETSATCARRRRARSGRDARRPERRRSSTASPLRCATDPRRRRGALAVGAGPAVGDGGGGVTAGVPRVLRRCRPRVGRRAGRDSAPAGSAWWSACSSKQSPRAGCVASSPRRRRRERSP